MWTKISISVALFALLTWSIFKLMRLNRQEKRQRRTFREPILNSKTTNSEGDYTKDFSAETKQEADLEDSDSVLGLKSRQTAVINNPNSKTAANSAHKAKAPVTLVIYLMAPSTKPYVGYELLQALLAAGLRYGTHQIFHRHEQKNGSGPILFHLASANAPGTFELAKMGAFSCPGLSFFMQLNDKVDNLQAFETLLDTANELRNELGGELRDEERKNLSMDKITEYRLRIREYQQVELNRLPDFFEQEI